MRGLYRGFLLGQGEFADSIIIIDPIGQAQVDGIAVHVVNVLPLNFISGEYPQNGVGKTYQFFFVVGHMIILRIQNLVLPEVQ